MMYFLERDDAFALSDYLELQAWPGPRAAKTVVTFDPTTCTENDVRRAIVEPYFDDVARTWRLSPFSVRGFDPIEDGPAD